MEWLYDADFSAENYLRNYFQCWKLFSHPKVTPSWQALAGHCQRQRPASRAASPEASALLLLCCDRPRYYCQCCDSFGSQQGLTWRAFQAHHRRQWSGLVDEGWYRLTTVLNFGVFMLIRRKLWLQLIQNHARHRFQAFGRRHLKSCCSIWIWADALFSDRQSI